VSELIVRFPDCAELGSNDPGDRGQSGSQDVITVYTESCPALVNVEAPPPLVPWWAWVLQALVLIAFIVATAIVRHRRHERLEKERTDELTAEVALNKTCRICGHNPKMKEKA
jgi:GAF domain-containing protein